MVVIGQLRRSVTVEKTGLGNADRNGDQWHDIGKNLPRWIEQLPPQLLGNYHTKDTAITKWFIHSIHKRPKAKQFE